MQEVVYNKDRRYPGPKAHPPPAHIKGIPTQDELDAFPRMFTWGELKAVVSESDLSSCGDNIRRAHRAGQLRNMVRRTFAKYLRAEYGDLELMMRNKAMQARYDEWMTGIKAQYGSTGALLPHTPCRYVHLTADC